MAILVVIASVPAAAQTDRGVISGRVADQQSGIVLGVSVVARHVETGAEYRTVTTSTGDYTLSSLPARSYELTIEAPGFKTFVATVRVQVAQATRVDAVLEIGATARAIDCCDRRRRSVEREIPAIAGCAGRCGRRA